MKPKDQKRIIKAINHMEHGPCILCGRQSVTGAMFSPDDPTEFGGHPGKRRIVIYGLCLECGAMPDAHKRAEDFIRFMNSKPINGDQTKWQNQSSSSMA